MLYRVCTAGALYYACLDIPSLSVLCHVDRLCGDGAGKDLITDVSCSEPYEWKDKTDGEWEFSATVPDSDAEKFHVSPSKPHL